MSHYPTDGPADPSGSQKPDPQPQRRRGELPQFKLILHSGSTRDAMFIVNTITEFTRLGTAEATQKMWEAHHNGRSQVLATHRERAELLVEQLQERGLVVSLEPA